MDKKKTEEQMRMFHDIIKKKKIPSSYLVEATGYSRSHISAVLTGGKSCTPQFYRLLSLALKKILEEDEEELKQAMEDLWKPSSSHLQS